MKKFMLLAVMLGYASASSAITICKTIEQVAIGQTVDCVGPARTAGSTSFYVNFDSLVRGNKYLCTFSSSPVSAYLLPEKSKFPEGTIYSFSNSSYNFPLSIDIDTINMVNKQELLQISSIRLSD